MKKLFCTEAACLWTGTRRGGNPKGIREEERTTVRENVYTLGLGWVEVGRRGFLFQIFRLNRAWTRDWETGLAQRQPLFFVGPDFCRRVSRHCVLSLRW